MKTNEFIMKRDVFFPKRTLSTVHLQPDVDGPPLFFVCEDTDRRLEDGGAKEKGITAIPRGRYKIALTMSGRFKRVLPELLDVPQFSGIRIHSGNTEVDTEGCLLPGLSRTDTAVLQSVVAVAKWIGMLEDADENYITIT